MIQQVKAWLNGRPTLGKRKKGLIVSVRLVYPGTDTTFPLEVDNEEDKLALLHKINYWWHHGGPTWQHGGLHVKREGLLAMHVS